MFPYIFCSIICGCTMKALAWEGLGTEHMKEKLATIYSYPTK